MLVNLRACWVIALAALVWPAQPVALAAGTFVFDGEITVAKRKKRKRRRRRPKKKKAVKPVVVKPRRAAPEPAQRPSQQSLRMHGLASRRWTLR